MPPSSSSSSSNIPREYATPRKDRHPFPQSSYPSPAPMKLSSSTTSNSSVHTHSTSTSSMAQAPAAPPTPVITVEGVLRQNASAPDPTAAALDQVVIERNTLSSQNAQLWKLIEKQRKGYNDILKELDRLRKERDDYRNRLHAVGGSVEKLSSKGDRTPKVSVVEIPSSAKQPAYTNGTSRNNSSEEYLGPRLPSSLHSSRSHEPLSARGSNTNLQSNAAQAQIPTTPSRSQTDPLPPPSSAPSLTTPNTARTTHRHPPSPLVLAARNDNRVQVPVSSTLETSSLSRQAQAFDDLDTAPPTSTSTHPYPNGKSSAYPARKSSLADQTTPVSAIPITNHSSNGASALHNYPASSMAPAAASSQKREDYEAAPSAPSRSLPLDSRTPASALPAQSNGNSRGTPPIITTSTVPNYSQPPLSPSQQMLGAATLDARSPYLSRDSRITLPDEARQYIANMADSPASSPRFNNFSTPTASAMPASALKESTVKGEFLELSDEDDDEDTEEEVESEADADFDVKEYAASRPSLQLQEPATPTNFGFSRSGESVDEATLTRRKDQPRVGTEEFPLPPPSSMAAQRQQSLPSQDGQPSQQLSLPQGVSLAKASNSTDQLPTNIIHQSQESLNTARGYNNSQHPGPPTTQSEMRLPTTATPSAQALSAAFRALPLLSSDLPRTTIAVSHSFVRPNDRGKEVLSFIVTVNPGNGKPGWKVEKMYSDVLSLDQRVRSSVGKGVGKKIANLPEGKLWKDHAPARVDQRKAVLEQYLQSLIQLPIKSNDEVIAFFTSDIVRETKQPVMQVGHKEGYLTKRGKNFGGWKTRFFVLQGPVLEYYDCRGGQHLGSIQITGAQIARQHRTDKTTTTDEEKEYRHAFLIVEAKKGPGGNHPRHVLCAESDEERDDWVELLVRYYTGTYNEELIFNQNPGLNPANSNSFAATQHSASPSQPRSSTSSSDLSYSTPSRKQPSRPSLTTDDYMRSSSPSRSIDPSPIDRNNPAGAAYDAQLRRAAERAAGMPSSLPDSSPLSSVPPILSEGTKVERANSELGHYPDLQEQQAPRSAQPRQLSPERHRPREVYEGRQTNYSATNLPNTGDRAPTPDNSNNPRVKISAPMNGAPIPSGFKFGGKDPSSDSNSSAERREKAKSRSFWGFGKTNGERSHPAMAPRAVFAVPLVESLDVAQICGLPAIVFRSIQYLEAKKADQEEGIYRLNGSSAVIKALRDRFNTEGDVDLLATDEYLDPHAVAGLLKSFLRDLPDSILTRELHLRFLAVIDLMDAQERIRELSQLIGSLPISNYTLLRALTAHLILIVQNANVNKMTMRNVGIVFSPTLGIPAGVFSLMLGEFNRVFNVDQDNDDEEEGPQEEDSTKLSSEQTPEPLRRNSRQYTDNAADQYLGLTGRSLHAPPADDAHSQSDGDDFSVQDESGTEYTEGEGSATFDSSSSSASPVGDSSVQDHSSIRISPPDTPVASKISKASSVAASKGLNLTVTGAERGNRHSRLIGLPTSPRPNQTVHSPSRQNTIEGTS
ncbi:hypothetical protein D9611_006244 [Ephemerocybe angulata]|uniref:RhoGAP-domain-containing protein n=1 Tax=Ephemerocybe angulata TaxID=980116 RepID=A0A8H5FGQ7_9AGAR|nr:hypothetical protein D9611_006244 [Tulosesus angulatus]